MSMWAYDFKSGDLYYNITNDTLPPFTASVTYEKSSSSANYSNLINVEIPATATFYDGTIYHITSIGSSAFNQCKSLVSVTIPESVTQIANNAFSSCSSLTNVIIPTSVVSIGRNAFSWCSSLALIDIPNNVSWVGDAAFSGTPWYNNQPDGVIYAGLNLYRYKGEMPANTSIQVNEGTKSISEHAFSTGCSSLVSIDIPNSVSCIGYAAFSNCSSLTSISIPESIKRIETWTFSNCSSLDTIILPDSITFIGSEAFKGCTLLTSVTIP